MNKIPLHRLSEQFQGEVAIMRFVSTDNVVQHINYAHRDDYYVFMLVEEGTGKMLIDFKEYEITDGKVHCILPGQVHFPIGPIKARGWFLAIDRIFVREEYKKIFERTSLSVTRTELTATELNDLKHCARMIENRLQPNRQHIRENILHDLFSFYIGLIAEIYQKGSPLPVNNRFADITYQFKSMLAKNYQTMKRPSQYANLLHLSPIYLNEAVKKTTGQSVSDCIQQEIVTQAKRLLYYTSLSIKEIAQELGYEDYAYFTRLFTRLSAITPTHFRKKYLK